MKFYGKVGFESQVDKGRGVYVSEIVEKAYSGDINRFIRRSQSSGDVNGSVSVSHEVSIISDPYASENFYNIKYVEIMGKKWEVSNVDVQYPRLNLSLGGLYNEKKR